MAGAPPLVRDFVPDTPPGGYAPWTPRRGAAPAPRKGHWPLTLHPEILKDFRGGFVFG